jgi:hypothetical protein
MILNAYFGKTMPCFFPAVDFIFKIKQVIKKLDALPVLEPLTG